MPNGGQTGSIPLTWRSTARANLEHALGDVDILLAQHDAQTGGVRGRPNRDFEVLKRAGVILAVTAWESYIEDTLLWAFRQCLKAAETPADIDSAFASTADWWLQKKPSRSDYAQWTGEGWKKLLLSHLETQLEKLHTPSTGNIQALSKCYLGEDITAKWKWQGTSAESARRRLDQLIAHRGMLVHHGRELFERRQSVLRRDVVRSRGLVAHLAQCTDAALGIPPTTVSGWC